MLIGDYQKLTLIDYPGKLAAIVFTVGCSFRCFFCHNPELVENSGQWEIYQKNARQKEKEFFELLEKRKGLLDGVCITGGEPTLQPDLLEFMKKIKNLGFAVKLDSNGTRPEVLRQALERELVDYFAMDIKHSPKKYSEAVGVEADIEKIKESVKIIMVSGVEYEFRTTVVPGIHREEDFMEIAEWIAGAPVYYLQKYRETKILDPNLKSKTRGQVVDLEKIKNNIEKHFGKIEIR